MKLRNFNCSFNHFHLIQNLLNQSLSFGCPLSCLSLYCRSLHLCQAWRSRLALFLRLWHTLPPPWSSECFQFSWWCCTLLSLGPTKRFQPASLLTQKNRNWHMSDRNLQKGFGRLMMQFLTRSIESRCSRDCFYLNWVSEDPLARQLVLREGFGCWHFILAFQGVRTRKDFLRDLDLLLTLFWNWEWFPEWTLQYFHFCPRFYYILQWIKLQGEGSVVLSAWIDHTTASFLFRLIQTCLIVRGLWYWGIFVQV